MFDSQRVRRHNTDFYNTTSGLGSGNGPYIAMHDAFQGVRLFLSYTSHDILVSDRYFHLRRLFIGKGTSDLFRIPLL